MLPSLRSVMFMQLPDCRTADPGAQPENAGNGRDSSKRESVGLVNRVVPSNPGTRKNGLGSSWSQNDRLPPSVGSHRRWNSADGSLNPFHADCISLVRLPA